MKITPVMTGTGSAGQNTAGIMTERTSPETIARAQAIALGQSPASITPSDTPVDPQVTRAQQTLRSIKMKVNQSPDRAFLTEDIESSAPESNTLVNNEEVVTEETRPLSPQLAALAKQRRALQVKERELLAKEKELEARSVQPNTSNFDRLKSEPLRVLEEEGILTPEFYNAFTEYLVSGQNQHNAEIHALRAELKAQKEEIQKTLTDRDSQAEQQALSEMRKEAELLAKDGDTFELVRATGGIPKVMDLIYRTFKSSGEVLDVRDAMQLVEEQLLEDNLKIAGVGKIRSKLLPPPEPQAPKTNEKQFRTLTNKDTAQMPLDRRTRALMAARGELRK